MNINIPNDPVNTAGPNVTFALGDNGSAHVSMILDVPGVARIHHDETYSGAVTRTLAMQPGKHDCTLLISAFKTGALGPVYASYLSINGQTVASANGAIPNNIDSEYSYKHFSLIVE